MFEGIKNELPIAFKKRTLKLVFMGAGIGYIYNIHKPGQLFCNLYQLNS